LILIVIVFSSFTAKNCAKNITKRSEIEFNIILEVSNEKNKQIRPSPEVFPERVTIGRKLSLCESCLVEGNNGFMK
jgi:hypothetical protein